MASNVCVPTDTNALPFAYKTCYEAKNCLSSPGCEFCATSECQTRLNDAADRLPVLKRRLNPESSDNVAVRVAHAPEPEAPTVLRFAGQEFEKDPNPVIRSPDAAQGRTYAQRAQDALAAESFQLTTSERRKKKLFTEIVNAANERGVRLEEERRVQQEAREAVEREAMAKQRGKTLADAAVRDRSTVMKPSQQGRCVASEEYVVSAPSSSGLNDSEVNSCEESTTPERCSSTTQKDGRRCAWVLYRSTTIKARDRLETAGLGKELRGSLLGPAFTMNDRCAKVRNEMLYLPLLTRELYDQQCCGVSVEDQLTGDSDECEPEAWLRDVRGGANAGICHEYTKLLEATNRQMSRYLVTKDDTALDQRPSGGRARSASFAAFEAPRVSREDQKMVETLREQQEGLETKIACNCDVNAGRSPECSGLPPASASSARQSQEIASLRAKLDAARQNLELRDRAFAEARRAAAEAEAKTAIIRANVEAANDAARREREAADDVARRKREAADDVARREREAADGVAQRERKLLDAQTRAADATSAQLQARKDLAYAKAATRNKAVKKVQCHGPAHSGCNHAVYCDASESEKSCCDRRAQSVGRAFHVCMSKDEHSALSPSLPSTDAGAGVDNRGARGARDAGTGLSGGVARAAPSRAPPPPSPARAPRPSAPRAIPRGGGGSSSPSGGAAAKNRALPAEDAQYTPKPFMYRDETDKAVKAVENAGDCDKLTDVSIGRRHECVLEFARKRTDCEYLNPVQLNGNSVKYKQCKEKVDAKQRQSASVRKPRNPAP